MIEAEIADTPTLSPDLTEALSIDQQEAGSIRYAVGLRLALLESGNWAVWYPELKLADITPKLSAETLQRYGELEREQRRGYWREYEAKQVERREYPERFEHETATRGAKSTDRSAEDLDL